jgi:hypothetical protein
MGRLRLEAAEATARLVIDTPYATSLPFRYSQHCRGMLASLCGAVLASVGGTNGPCGSGTKFEVGVREMAGLVAITQVGSGIPCVVTPEQMTFVL